uniref:Selenoprotein F n=1 Tax=Mesocestoides corti TaxID=53468 RepID=A0A5K3F9I9_MESCO
MSGVASVVDSGGRRLTCGSGFWLANKACSLVPVFFLLGLGKYPQIHAFVDHKMRRFRNVRFVAEPGHRPTAILLNEERGEAQETYSIELWDTNTIEEFFRERLL